MHIGSLNEIENCDPKLNLNHVHKGPFATFIPIKQEPCLIEGQDELIKEVESGVAFDWLERNSAHTLSL